MKILIKLLSLNLLILPLTAVGLEASIDQQFTADNNGIIVATISKREITRVAFENEITFISSIAGELEYTTKEQDLYLRPNVEKPINFFVKTADEHTYKFLVSANDTPATQIFIKSNVQQNSKDNVTIYGQHHISKELQNRISKLIDVALTPHKFLGFSFKKTNEYLESIHDLSMQQVAEVSGMHLKAEIIVIANESNVSKPINLEWFLDEKIMAVYVEQPILKAGEKIKLIRIKGSK